MKKSIFTKQAKSDIFKELYRILSFYIKKGAGPKSLKKYYNNSKRFNELLQDINNKSINLFDDDKEYKDVVKEILNDILDDFIAKEKDEYYRNQEKKMTHVKEFNSFKINEDIISGLLSAGSVFFLYKFFKGLLADIKPRTREDIEAEIYNIQTKQLKHLISIIEGRWSNGEGLIELEEDIVYYNIKFHYPERYRTGAFSKTLSIPLIIKINKNDSTIKWKFEDEDDTQFTLPIKMKRVDMIELIDSLKEDIKSINKFNENWITDSTGKYDINYNKDNISEIAKEVKMYIEENFNKISSINSENPDFLSINFNNSNDILFAIHLRKKDNFYILDFREKDNSLNEHEVDITKEDFDYLFNFILYIHRKFRYKEQYTYKQKVRLKLLGADKYNL